MSRQAVTVLGVLAYLVRMACSKISSAPLTPTTFDRGRTLRRRFDTQGRCPGSCVPRTGNAKIRDGGCAAVSLPWASFADGTSFQYDSSYLMAPTH